MNIKLIIAGMTVAFSLGGQAQTNKSPADLVPVTIYLTPANAALVADFQSNDVPIDTVITLGAKATLNQAKERLLVQIGRMTFDQLAAAYPQLLSVVDSNSPASVQEQQLRTIVSMQLSKIRTPGDACRMSSLLQGPGRGLNGNAASTNTQLRAETNTRSNIFP